MRFALEEGVNRRELCRRFQISPDVGYKWLARWGAGDRELADRSRRPHISPRRCNEAVEAEVLAVRDAHPQCIAAGGDGARTDGSLIAQMLDESVEAGWERTVSAWDQS